MLRTVVFVLGTMLAATGAWLWSRGVTLPGIQALGVGGILALGLLVERWRYQKTQLPADTQWHPTGERFVDPTSGKNVEVLYDPASGERRYVERSNRLSEDR